MARRPGLLVLTICTAFLPTAGLMYLWWEGPELPATPEEQAIAALEHAGYRVTRESSRAGSHLNVTALPADGCRSLDEVAPHLRQLPGLQSLNLSGTQVNDASLRQLKGLGGLQTLILAYTPVTDAGLEVLSEVSDLRTLDLSGTRVTDRGLPRLKGCGTLQTLVLADTQVGDGALGALQEAGLLHVLSRAAAQKGKRPAGPEQVASLDLSGTGVTEGGMQHLKGLPGLRTLVLHDAQITDEMLAALRRVGLLHVLSQATAYEEGRPSSPEEVFSLDLSGTRVTHAGICPLKGLRGLRMLVLHDAQITDEMLDALRKAEMLHVLDRATAQGESRPSSPEEVLSLDLSGTEVTDGGLAQLGGLRGLRVLDLGATPVVGEGFQHLQELGSLQSLYLPRTKVTDASLSELKRLRGLRTLDLSLTEVTDEGLGELKELPRLEALGLIGTDVTDAGLRELKELNNLQTLDLSGTRVTDGGLQQLKGCRGLQTLILGDAQLTDGALCSLHEVGLLHLLSRAAAYEGSRPFGPEQVLSLDLSGTRVTDAGLQHLEGLPGLQTLDLRETDVTQAGADRLRKHLPECLVVR